MFCLNKFSLIILTRCNLQCRLCCEYVPQNRPFPDMTVPEEKRLLEAFFQVADRVETLHLTGGGEPFLHPALPEMIDAAMEYADRFDRLMLFTNCTIPVSDALLDALKRNREKLLVQLSQYGVNPEREAALVRLLTENGIRCKVEKYYGEKQSFDGWIDFGPWVAYGRTPEKLCEVFHACSVTGVLKGNWRTRDGKVHWCSRSQRGMELGLIPDRREDYVDLFDETMSREEKQREFGRIAELQSLLACDYCSGLAGTVDSSNRRPAADQMKKGG